MPNNEEARPSCPECGRTLDPRAEIVVVSDDDQIDESIPDGLALRPIKTVFAGLYCCSDCVIDAIQRGFPKIRSHQ